MKISNQMTDSVIEDAIKKLDSLSITDGGIALAVYEVYCDLVGVDISPSLYAAVLRASVMILQNHPLVPEQYEVCRMLDEIRLKFEGRL
jgi:hypothetical protein